MQARLSVEGRLNRAQELVEALKRDEPTRVANLISELARDHNQDLFCEVGRLTREVHETLNNFLLDNRLPTLAENEIPDARQRLNHVIDMTEEATHQTLGAVEDSLPTLRDIKGRAGGFRESWQNFRRSETPLEHLRMLSYDLDRFLEQIITQARHIERNLSGVMMAQASQDLAGQLIRQVIQLVQEVEDSLVEIVRITGQGRVSLEKTEVDASGRGYGPAVDGEAGACSQDEVDELLSSLGF